LPVEECVRRLRGLANRAAQADLIFKKIDSTMRGNIHAEIAAAKEAFGCERAIVTPAFPEMGRVVRGNQLFIHGVATLEAGEGVLDAVTDADLDTIAGEGLAYGKRVLWAGSAGLASALARRLCGPSVEQTIPLIDGPIALCIGSDHPATAAQRQELQRCHPGAWLVTIERARTTAEEIRELLAGAAALFITGGDTATKVLQAVGARRIAIQQEVVTGVPWGLLCGGMFDGCPVVTKSGGFGAPDTLVKVANFFPTAAARNL
jgi:uncharacterized protein YgbK (DUF1537 family)